MEHTFSSRPSPRAPPSIMQTYRSTNVARVCCGPSSLLNDTRSSRAPTAEVASITSSRGRGGGIITGWPLGIHAGNDGNNSPPDYSGDKPRFRVESEMATPCRNSFPCVKCVSYKLSLGLFVPRTIYLCGQGQAGRGCFSLRPHRLKSGIMVGLRSTHKHCEIVASP